MELPSRANQEHTSSSLTDGGDGSSNNTSKRKCCSKRALCCIGITVGVLIVLGVVGGLIAYFAIQAHLGPFSEHANNVIYVSPSVAAVSVRGGVGDVCATAAAAQQTQYCLTRDHFACQLGEAGFALLNVTSSPPTVLVVSKPPNDADGSPLQVIVAALCCACCAHVLQPLSPSTSCFVPPTHSCSHFPLPPHQVHDVSSVGGDLFFLLDARSGAVWMESANAAHTQLSRVPNQAPISVPVGPYSGVSAAATTTATTNEGLVVVSGGTDLLSVLSWTRSGGVASGSSTLKVARGQPDVVVNGNATLAYVSTHIEGDDFGITSLQLSAPPTAPSVRGQLRIEGAGFQPGVTRPANFPLHAAFLNPGTLLVTAGSALVEVQVPQLREKRRFTWEGYEAVGVCTDSSNRGYVVSAEPPSLRAIVLATGTVDVARSLPEDSRPLSCAVFKNPMNGFTKVLVAANSATPPYVTMETWM